MNDPALFGPSHKSEHQVTEQIDWRTVAPRWLLLLVIVMSFAAIGSLSTQLFTEKSERQQRIEDALKESPNRYQARLSERVAILETQTQRLHDAVSELTVQLRSQGTVTSELTVQLKILTAELRQKRVR